MIKSFASPGVSGSVVSVTVEVVAFRKETPHAKLPAAALLEPIEWTADGWFIAKGGDLGKPLKKPSGTSVGTHGMAHGLGTLLEAADRLRGENVHILMLGDGAEKKALQTRAMAMGLDNLTFLDSVPKEEVARYWSLLDASIIQLRKTPLFETTIPSKMFEAMGMGIPILLGVRGEAEIIEDQEGDQL